MSAMAAQYVPPPSAFASSSGGGAQHSNTSSPNMRMNESPLDTLVRRTSSRRVRQPGEGNEVRRPRDVHRGNQRQQQAESSSAVNAYDGDQRYTQQHQRPYQAQYQQYNDEDEDDFSEAYATSSYYEPDDDSRPNSHVQAPAQDQRQGVDAEGPRRQMADLRLEIKPNAMAETLHSPLLHSHFARDSVATASDMNSYYGDMDSARTGRASSHSPSRSARSPTGSAMEFDAGRYFADDASSVYSNTTALGGPALRDSWRSTDTGGTVRRPDGDYRDSGAGLPSVVVSSAEQDGAYAIGGGVGQQVKAGRTPIVKPVTANFSRPVREAARPEQEAVGERVQVQVPADMREQKKAVLERNARRGNLEASPQPYMRSPLAREVSAEDARPSVDMQRGRSPQPSTSQLHPLHGSTMRPVSPATSVYSTYSYYQYDGAVPSPTGSQFDSVKPNQLQRPQTASPRPQSSKGSDGPQTPQDYLQLGIQYHEANRLQESVRCFERAAKEDGGCGVGMLMYGLALRHGWGCVKNEALGFKWVQKAAENAVGDLEKVRTGGREIDLGAVQSELVLAIYEVGQCFFHGWGVAKDQKMGVSYYAVAARLGDGDAQSDLAFCLANGKGCKKDKKGAAKWYRAAVAQGQSDVGLAWIYKDKYQ